MRGLQIPTLNLHYLVQNITTEQTSASECARRNEVLPHIPFLRQKVTVPGGAQSPGTA